MEEKESVPILSRKELRKQKLMEYLTAKGKLKVANPKLGPGDNCQVKNPLMSVLKGATGKENNAPVDYLKYEARKVKTLAPQPTHHPVRRGFGVAGKVIVEGSIRTAQQNSTHSSATSGPAQPKLHQNRVLTNTNAASSRSNLYAASHLKKQPNTGIQSLVKASSNPAFTAVAKPNSKFSGSSNATRSSPMTTVSVRMSLGPIVKTKTGLVPAMIQPRNTKSNLTRTSASAANTIASVPSVPNKVQSRTTSSVSVSKSASVAQRKVPLITSVCERTTLSHNAKAVIKTQDQKKPHNKPPLGEHSQPSWKSQLLGAVKSTSIASKCKAAPVKFEGKVGIPKTNPPAGHPTGRSTKQRSQGEGEKNGKSSHIAARTSGPPSRCSVRSVCEVTQPVAGLRGEPKTFKYTESKKGCSSVKAPPPQKSKQRPSVPILSHTVPRPSRTISYSGKTADTTRPKVPVTHIPQTEGQKRTAAQEERMNKLQAWREAKGIAYKRPPMPVKPPVRRTESVPSFWANMKEEDEARSLTHAVDRSLADCLKLLGEGCWSDQVKEVLSRLPPLAQKFAKYWICQVRVMEEEGNLDVLPVFEEAVRVVLEPVDELRAVVFEILKKKDEIQASKQNENKEEEIPGTVENNPMTPKPVRALISGHRGDSSVIKYKITATPGGPASQQRGSAQLHGQELRFFTPVRRSVRIERASLQYPVSLQDHDLCVASYNELIAEEKEKKEQEDGEASASNESPMYIYRENEALKDKVLVQLFCDEDGTP